MTWQSNKKWLKCMNMSYFEIFRSYQAAFFASPQTSQKKHLVTSARHWTWPKLAASIDQNGFGSPAFGIFCQCLCLEKRIREQKHSKVGVLIMDSVFRTHFRRVCELKADRSRVAVEQMASLCGVLKSPPLQKDLLLWSPQEAAN